MAAKKNKPEKDKDYTAKVAPDTSLDKDFKSIKKLRHS